VRLGILADTHGLLRPEVLEVFGKVDLILHAGDVEDPEILDQLQALAPVTAVRGNVDIEARLRQLPPVAELKVDGFVFVVTHGHRREQPVPDSLMQEFPHADVVVYGHTHRAGLREYPDYRLAVNPGSAGLQRYENEAPSVAIMETEPGIPPRARIVRVAESLG
jgi:uncharacterized protein